MDGNNNDDNDDASTRTVDQVSKDDDNSLTGVQQESTSTVAPNVAVTDRSRGGQEERRTRKMKAMGSRLSSSLQSGSSTSTGSEGRRQKKPPVPTKFDLRERRSSTSPDTPTSQKERDRRSKLNSAMRLKSLGNERDSEHGMSSDAGRTAQKSHADNALLKARRTGEVQRISNTSAEERVSKSGDAELMSKTALSNASAEQSRIVKGRESTRNEHGGNEHGGNEHGGNEHGGNEHGRRSRRRVSSARRRVHSARKRVSSARRSGNRASSILAGSQMQQTYDLDDGGFSVDGEENADSIGSDDPSYLFDGESGSDDNISDNEDTSRQHDELQPGAIFIPLPVTAEREEFGGERFLWDSTLVSAPSSSQLLRANNANELSRPALRMSSVFEAQVVPDPPSSPPGEQQGQGQQGDQALQDALRRYFRSQPEVSVKNLSASASTHELTAGSLTSAPSATVVLPHRDSDDTNAGINECCKGTGKRRCVWLIFIASTLAALAVVTGLTYCRVSQRCDESQDTPTLIGHRDGKSSSPTASPELRSSALLSSFAPTPHPTTATSAPTAPPTSSRYFCFRRLLVGREVTSASDLDDPATPQHRALRWIADDDEVQLHCLSEWAHEEFLALEGETLLSTTAGLLANRVIQRYVIGTFYLATTLGDRRMDRNHGLPPREENQWEGESRVGGGTSSQNYFDPADDIASETFLNASMHECDIPRVVLCARDRLVSTIVAEKLQTHGSFPSELGSLFRLEAILLGGNELVGTLPDSLSKLDRLTALILFDNNLSGTIPVWLGNMPRLRGVDFQDNALHGALPSSLGNLVNLDTLELGGNSLTGTLPTTLGNLRSLERLSLQGNDFSGSIPHWVNNESFPNLLVLRLNHNRLTGSIPTHLASLSHLKTLVLMGNELNGTIPSELNNLHELRELILAANDLTGTIPFEEGAFPYLTNLWLFRCRLSGSMPESLFAFTTLESLMLSTNNLWGTIPSLIGAMEKLNRLELSNNQLSGSLPSEVAMMSGLVALDVSNNTLIGTLPSTLGSSLQMMATFVLSANKLTGTVPATIGSMTNLLMLLLDNNPGLTGDVPSTLANLHCLEFLDLHGTALGNLDETCEVAGHITHFHSDCPTVACPCCTACCDEEGTCYENTASDPEEVEFALVRGSFVDWFSATALGKASTFRASKRCLADIIEIFECACQENERLCPFECEEG